jgi:tetratricopeptide (TPR) repeat protein
MGYANHNQHFLAAAACMDGEFDTALDAARALESNMHQAMAAMTTLTLMRFARWDDVLRLAAPDARMTGLEFFRRLARGCAFASKGKLQEAEGERAAMEETFRRLPEGRAFGTFFNDWSVLNTLAEDTLAARMAAARGDANAAIGYWRAAVTVQDGMNFDDVPDWYYPIRESLGAALLGNKQAAEAEQTFRDDLRRNPRNPRSLFGLALALEAQGKAYEAGFVRQAFEAAWKGTQQPRIEDF